MSAPPSQFRNDTTTSASTEQCPKDEARGGRDRRLRLDRLPSLAAWDASATHADMPPDPSRPGPAPSGGDDPACRGQGAACNPGALSNVADVFRRYFGLVSPHDIPKAMVGFNILGWHDWCDQHTRRAAQDSESDGLLHSRDGSAAEILAEALRYMKFATATYGQLVLNPLMFPGKELSKLLPGQVILEQMKEHAGMDAEAYMAHAVFDSHWLRPAHFVVHDPARRELVVAIRGTLSVEDVLTDLGGQDVAFFAGGKAHQSMLQSAGHVVESISPTLHELFPDIERITVTGHSLGGGVATYVAWMLAELLQEGAGTSCADIAPGGGVSAAGLVLRCFAFGSPGVCSLEVARGAGSRVFCICNGDDLVPQLSFGSILELHDRAVAAANRASVHCSLLPDVTGIGSGGDAPSEPGFVKLAARTATAMDSLRRCVAATKPSDTEDFPRHEKLYPAGRVLLVRRDGRIAEVDALQAAPRVIIHPSMLKDHMPHSYETSLQAAVRRYEDHVTRCPS